MSAPAPTREEMLAAIERRMRANGIFYQDIWERVLQTADGPLREIYDSDFEHQVLAMKVPQ